MTRQAADIPVKARVVPSRRASLHRLLDEILDRRPDLEEQLQVWLRHMVEMSKKPEVVVSMRMLTAGRQALDAILDFQGRGGGRPPFDEG